MSLPEVTALSRHLDECDPSDRVEQGYNLDRLRELCEYVRRRGQQELAACLEATAHLLEALAGPGEQFDRSSVHGIACGLLRTVEQALSSFDSPGAQRPENGVEVGPETHAVTQTAATTGPSESHWGSSPEEGGSPPDRKESESPSLEPKGNPELPLINNMVFGRLVVELGYATRKQVAEALKLHRKMGLPVGECLLISGSTTPDRLLEALKIQERMRALAEGSPMPDVQVPLQPQVQGLEPGDASLLVTKQIFFGEVLLGMNMITKQQLEKAMHIHYFEGLRVGQALVGMGVLTMDDVQRGLDIQRSLLHAAGLPTEGR